ncbi:MAG: hypothetical protein M1824_006052 [Vezdaea acicularis]|nr:MAG: hypothetical protein M1824_006052 [Vezdaea acicularis]
MPFFKKPLAGPGYIILNIIRVLNIIALLSVIVASWVMLVKTFRVSQFYFFDAVSHVTTFTISLFLIISELPICKDYFARNWPLLSPQSGFVALGVAMITVGCSILGNLNKEATRPDKLGPPFWRIVIAAGIVVTVLGFVNIVASYVFRDKDLGITARHVRQHGATAPQKDLSSSPSTASNRSRKSFRMMAGRSTPLPSYHPSTSRFSRAERNPKLPLTISRPMINEEQFRKITRSATPIERPDDAYHPGFQQDGYSNKV